MNTCIMLVRDVAFRIHYHPFRDIHSLWDVYPKAGRLEETLQPATFAIAMEKE